MRSTHTKTMHLQAVIEKLTRMLAQSDVVVTQRGSGAYCKFDDKTGKVKAINLPMIPPNPSEQFIQAIQGYLDHEVAHALLTSGKEWKAGAEDDRNMAGVGKSLRHNLINVVEDIRIENTIPQHYPGATANLQAVRQFLIDTVWAPQLDKLLKTGADMGVIQTCLLVPFLRALGGHQACVDWCDSINAKQYFETLMKRFPDLAERLKALKSTAEAARLADDLIRTFDHAPASKPPEPEKGKEKDKTKGDRGQPDDDEDGEGSGDQGEDGDDADDEGDDAGEGSGDAGDEEGDEDGSGGSGGSGDDEDEDGSGEGSGKRNTTLNKAMRHLSPEQRRAIFLYNNRKMSIDDIAKDLEMSSDDTAETLKIARRRLSNMVMGK